MENKVFYQETSQRPFLICLLNSVFILLGSLAIFFATFFPIGNALYGEDKKQMNEDVEVLYSIGEEAKLIHRFDNGDIYSINNSYEYFLRTILKYNYENSDYDLDIDSEKYKEKQDTFKPFIDISVTETTVNDDFMGNFYTQFIEGKKDTDGNLVLDFGSTNPKDYFYYEVLDIDGDGAKFFETTSGEYPYLKDDVRRALYSYNFLKNVSDKYYKVDTEFFQFFVQKFNISGEFLIKYEAYGPLLIRHNEIYTKLQNYDRTAIFVSSLAGFLSIIVIFPLFNKYKRNPAEIIFNRAYLVEKDEEEVASTKSFVIRCFYGVIKYFFAIFLLAFFVNPNLAFQGLFNLGVFPVSLFLFGIISLLINAVSLSISIARKDKKNLENLISQTRIYTVEKDYSKK